MIDYVLLQETVQFLMTTIITSGIITVPDGYYNTLETSIAYDCHCITPGSSTVPNVYSHLPGNSTIRDDNYVTLETNTAHYCHCITQGNSTSSDNFYMYIIPGSSTVPDNNYVYVTLETS